MPTCESYVPVQGAEVDIRNASNATPLHHAAMNNHIRVVERLLEVHWFAGMQRARDVFIINLTANSEAKCGNENLNLTR